MKASGTDNASRGRQEHRTASALAGGRVTNETVICLLVALVSLMVAAAFHHFAPGFGAVFKPLLWPLLVLPFTVRARFCLATSFAVPLLSCALTGMPTLPVALALSTIASAVTMVLSLVGVRGWVQFRELHRNKKWLHNGAFRGNAPTGVAS